MNPEVTGLGTSWIYVPSRSQPSNIWMNPASMITENTRLCWPTAAYLATMPCSIHDETSDTRLTVAHADRVRCCSAHRNCDCHWGRGTTDLAGSACSRHTVSASKGSQKLRAIEWSGVEPRGQSAHCSMHACISSSAPPKMAAKKPTNMLPYSPASGPRPADVQCVS